MQNKIICMINIILAKDILQFSMTCANSEFKALSHRPGD